MVLSYTEISKVLSQQQVGMDAAELHGALIGFLCAGGVIDEQHWLAELLCDNNPEQTIYVKATQELQGFLSDSIADLEDEDCTFMPLLPDDDHPLRGRAEALVSWCCGFLGGLGLVGVLESLELSEDTAEVIRDIERVAATRFADADIFEEDENAYSDVVEYLRVGVLMLRDELRAMTNGATRH